MDPFAHARSRHTSLLHLLRLKVRILRVLRDLDHDALFNIVLVIIHQVLDQVGSIEEVLLGCLPVVVDLLVTTVRVLNLLGLHRHHDADSFHDQPHGARRLLHHLDLEDVALREGVQRLDGALESWDGLRQVGLAGRLDGVCLIRLLLALDLVLGDDGLGRVRLLRVLVDTDQQGVGFFRRHVELGLQVGQVFLHLIDLRLGLENLR
mmetsp:Transcript_24885/g.57621  ORF Transcript_24885/g.57621 Transcript_24885/m.57621 type:complete len:207 (-) Transcript_24885:763-1383(-)